MPDAVSDGTVSVDWLYSPAGFVAQITLHTLGAIGLPAGVGLLIGWMHGMRRGHDDARLRTAGRWVMYVSLGMNLFGGAVRIYQPDHRHLPDPWAIAIFAKAALMLVALIAAATLLEVLVPRMRRGASEETYGRARIATGTIALVVVINVVLGSIAVALPSEHIDDHVTLAPSPMPVWPSAVDGVDDGVQAVDPAQVGVGVLGNVRIGEDGH